MSSNLPPVVPVFSGMQFNSNFYTPNTEPLTYEQMTTAFVEYPSAQGDISFRSADFSGSVVIAGDLSVNGTINGNGGGGGVSFIIATSTVDVSNQITPAGNLALSTTTNYIDVITNTLNGVSYTALGSGMNNVCSSIAIDPSTGDVYAGGTFTEAGGTPINYLAKWNGTTWSVVGDKIFDAPIPTVTFWRWYQYDAWNTVVNVMVSTDTYNFWAYAYAPAFGVEYQWNSVNDISPPISGLTVNNALRPGGENEPRAYVYFPSVSSIYMSPEPPVYNIVRMNDTYKLVLIHGTQKAFNASATPPQTDSPTIPPIFLAGSFTATTPANSVVAIQANNIVFFNKLLPENNRCIPLIAPLGGNGVRNATSDATVYALALDNTRNRLYVGGYFDTAGDVSANNIAYWDITLSNWFAMGNGVNAACRSLALDSARDILYAVGDFTLAGGQPTARVAVWDVTSAQWVAMPTGFNDIARSIQYDPSTNTYGVAGDFTTAGTTTVNRIARMSSEYLENVNVQVNGTTVKTLAKNETGIIMVAGGNGYNMEFTPPV